MILSQYGGLSSDTEIIVMNTPRILDIAPMSTVSNAPPGAKPVGRERPAVPELPSGSEAGGGVPDAARQRVDAERARLGEAEQAAAKRDKSTLQDEVRSGRNFSNRVGYFNGSSMVFVDLIDEKTQRELMRIFGPSRSPPEDVPPEDATRAYEEANARATGGRAARL